MKKARARKFATPAGTLKKMLETIRPFSGRKIQPGGTLPRDRWIPGDYIGDRPGASDRERQKQKPVEFSN